MWTADEHVAVMDRLGIEACLLSVSSPGVQFGDGVTASDAVTLAGHVNDVAAAAIAQHPGRFGTFASLPMADESESLAEIGRALDGLGLDGVNVLTNVNGVYLGDASLEAINGRIEPPPCHGVHPPDHPPAEMGNTARRLFPRFG